MPKPATRFTPTAGRATLRRGPGRVARALLAGIVIAGTTSVVLADTAFAAAESPVLSANEQLNPGQRLVSPDGRTVLLMQNDGNLVEYGTGNRPVWATGSNRAGAIARMQGDGNFVVIAPGNIAVWATGTSGNNNATAELQNDGNVVVYAPGHTAKWANGASVAPAGSTSTRDIASAILNNRNIALQTVHVSGVADRANARQNIVDTAGGGQATRSTYGTAPGGTVALDTRMLTALRQLGAEGALRVSELAGGTHVSNSKHYAGKAFDIDQYGGRSTATLITRCRQMGASYALFEDGTHVHCEWT